MQTFLPYDNFVQSVRCLDNKRLGKQRVECKQILLTLAKGPRSIKNGKEIKTPWYNHPATQMWEGYDIALSFYGWNCCEEWIKRGFKDSLQPFFFDYISRPDEMLLPWWLGMPEFHNSHKSKLLFKDLHYKQFGWEVPDNLEYVWPTKQK